MDTPVVVEKYIATCSHGDIVMFITERSLLTVYISKFITSYMWACTKRTVWRETLTRRLDDDRRVSAGTMLH